MTTVGWVGLGKLGLPCAVAMASRGITVASYDIDPERRKLLIFDDGRRRAEPEPGLVDALQEAEQRRTLLVADTMDALVAASPEMIFVCVQTPHLPGHDGSTPAPAPILRRSFDYTALRSAVQSIVDTGYEGPLVVVSTVTPGTMDRCIRPLLDRGITLIYNPAFPAMGSVIKDYLNPAFVLIGVDGAEGDEPEALAVIDLYRKMLRRDVEYAVTSIPSAELAKVAYNTFVTTKIVFANALMELCHHTGADVDEVTDTLALATDRVVSARYLHGGMGDGGACHPRDLIAMSADADRYELSYDPFDALIYAREAQTRWLADLAIYHAELAGLDTVVVLGKAYKAGTSITAGSAAVLLGVMLSEHGGIKVIAYDPLVDGTDVAEDVAGPAVVVLATPHDEFMAWELPAGSVLIDPWRTTWDGGPGVTRIGVGSR